MVTDRRAIPPRGSARGFPRNRMKNINTITRVSAAIATLVVLSGCANNPLMSNRTTADTAGGVGIGAIAGAVVGSAVGAPMAGAAIGGGLGGLAGYGVARSSQPQQYQQQPQQYQQQQPGFYQPPANNQPCPSGYNCTPVQPVPVCPSGYTCSPG